MPTYSYACTACDHRFDAVQSFSDDSLTVCPECGGRLRKVFNAVGVVFKGGGFYRTDSRSGSSASVPAAQQRLLQLVRVVRVGLVGQHLRQRPGRPPGRGSKDGSSASSKDGSSAA